MHPTTPVLQATLRVGDGAEPLRYAATPGLPQELRLVTAPAPTGEQRLAAREAGFVDYTSLKLCVRC